MARPSPRLAVLLAAAVALPAALLPLLPEAARPYNFAAFGAIAVFAAARGGRSGWAAGLVLALGAKLVSDLLNYRQHGYDRDYLPFGVWELGVLVYGGFALYAVFGWAARRHDAYWGVAGAVAGGLLFFLTTNYAAWARQDLPYGTGLAGLVESYTMALPFLRGTLAGDVLFTGGLFATHAVLVRALAPAAEPARS